MTASDFRRIALSFPEATESAHMDHPDFRVGGKIFATLDYPGKGWGMVKLPPKQQVFFIEAEPKVFAPAKGAWGLRGATNGSPPRCQGVLAAPRACRRLAQHRTQAPLYPL